MHHTIWFPRHGQRLRRLAAGLANLMNLGHDLSWWSAYEDIPATAFSRDREVEGRAADGEVIRDSVLKLSHTEEGESPGHSFVLMLITDGTGRCDGLAASCLKRDVFALSCVIEQEKRTGVSEMNRNVKKIRTESS